MPFQPSVLCSQLQNFCTTVIHFSSLNDFYLLNDKKSHSLWLIWALSACVLPVFAPSLLRDSFWTALSKTLCSSHTGNHLKKGTSLTAKPVFGTQWHLNGPSGAKGNLSRSDVGHLVKKIKIWRSLSPPRHKKYREGVNSNFTDGSREFWIWKKKLPLNFSLTQNSKGK